MATETLTEQCDRVRLMADGSPPWDLSPLDMDALNGVLADRAAWRMRAMEAEARLRDWDAIYDAANARASAAEARQAAFGAWVDEFEAETRRIPVGAEDKSKGSSVYNWRIWFVRQVRAALSASPSSPRDLDREAAAKDVEVASLRALIGHLNEKLDATHTNRCIRCAGTVTEATSKRQLSEHAAELAAKDARITELEAALRAPVVVTVGGRLGASKSTPWCGAVSADRKSICGNPKDECADHRCARPGCGHPKAMHETFDCAPACIGELPADAGEWTDCECPAFVAAPTPKTEAE